MRLGLALSGGGFRATLFHLGVVRFLRDINHLKDIVYVSSVSGGSILAAHLVLNWERYTDADKSEFDRAAQELVAFTQQDVRGWVVRRWLLAWPIRRFAPIIVSCVNSLGRALRQDVRWLSEWSITQFLQQQYSSLYNHQPLRSLKANGRPQIELLSTSMNNGLTCLFTDWGILVDAGPNAKATEVKAEYAPISLAVAASSAFPPLFPPIELSHNSLGVLDAEFPKAHQVCDGGIYDNLGIQMLNWSDRADTDDLQLDTVVLSDAGAPFDETHSKPFFRTFSRNLRSVEILMYRNSVLTYESLEKADSRETMPYAEKILRCRIGDLELPYGESMAGDLHRRLRRWIPHIRTDLDSFSKFEASLLVRHGYLAAQTVWKRKRSESESQAEDLEPWTVFPDELKRFRDRDGFDQADKLMQRTQRIRWLRFTFRDLAWLVISFIVIYLVFLITKRI